MDNTTQIKMHNNKQYIYLFIYNNNDGIYLYIYQITTNQHTNKQQRPNTINQFH